jgi:predicted transcriptional regulator
MLTYLSEDDLEKGRERKDMEKWNSDYLELMEYTKNPNYGKLKCFHCLLSPTGDDPIFIGINRLVSKGLIDGEQEEEHILYPCQVVNRFQCPYERTNVKKVVNSAFDVEVLFKLEKMAFVVEIALAKARKEDSRIRVRNREELLHALTDKKTLAKILEQGTQAHEVSEDIRTYLAENHDYILDYFIKIKDEVNMEELRFY